MYLFQGCQVEQIDPPIPVEVVIETSPTATLTAPSTVTPVPTIDNQSDGLENDRTKYSIEAIVDYAAKTVQVKQIVWFKNNYDSALDTLVLDVEPNRYINGFELGEAIIENRTIINQNLDRNKLEFELMQPLLPGEDLHLTISYALILPVIPPPSEQSKPQPYGYTENQLNLVDWYPFIPPFDPDTGWVVHPSWYFGEQTVYPSADFDVQIEFLNSPDSLVVAASSIEEIQGNTRKYSLENGRAFAISASPFYRVAEKTVDGIKVASYYFPVFEQAGLAVLDDTMSAISLYNEKFGVYPRESLAVVQADFLDGMEYDGLYFLSKGFYNLYDGTKKGYLTAIAVHETAHQWWFGAVGNDQAREPWLDESFATFSEKVYYENISPDDLAWWQYARIDFYEPQGFINQSVYDYSGFIPYRNAVYLRGAIFLENLRKELGEETFWRVIEAYYSQYSGGIATKASFFDIVAQINGEPIPQELQDQYFAK